jgi:hypothetical protein
MAMTEFDPIERQLIQAHIASGQPRYSIVLKLVGGAFIRNWTNDRAEALTRHAAAVEAANFVSVVTFDHLGLEALATDFPPDGRTPRQLKADCDQLIDQMIDRWLATTRH